MMRTLDSILFLDVDGVLNTRKVLLEGDVDPIDIDCAEQLERVIKESGCKIVISSTWRIFGEVYILRAINKALGRRSPSIEESVVGVTPSKTSNDECRGDEIQTWLDQNQNKVDKFAIVDDDVDMGDLMGHLVRTDPEFGLTEELADQLIERLTA